MPLCRTANSSVKTKIVTISLKLATYFQEEKEMIKINVRAFMLIVMAALTGVTVAAVIAAIA